MNNFINQQAEQCILGIILLGNHHIDKIADLLEPKHFYCEAHSAIFSRIIEVASDMTADQITLKDFFSNTECIKDIGGVKYLTVLLGEASSLIDIRDYAKKLVELWQKRELQDLLVRSIEALGENKFDTVTANFDNEVSGLAIRDSKKKTQHIAEMLDEMETDDKLGISGKYVPTGFKALDNLLNGGIYSQQLIIIGARPSVGKTTIGQNIILNVSKSGKKCLFISLEVDKRNVTLKFLSNLASVATWRILKKITEQHHDQGLIEAKKKLREMAIYTNDSSYLSISQIGKIIKNQLEKQPVDLVVVDYVQIIRGEETKNKNEALIIKENTTALKSFAKQFDVAVLALAQINRKAVEGANQEPTINDFKGSGGIEEDADVAIILHRDRSEDKKENYFANTGKLIIAKNRHGRTGEIAVDFDGEFGRFNEIQGL